MHIDEQQRDTRLPQWAAAGLPKVHKLRLTKREREILRRAAKIAARMRETVRETYGDELAYEDPWVDLGIAASALEDAAKAGELIIYPE